MIDIMDRLEVKRLKKEGLSNVKIAKRLGINRETVARILAEEKYENYHLPLGPVPVVAAEMGVGVVAFRVVLPVLLP